MGCGGTQQQTQKQELDPRMNAVLYGNAQDGWGGLYGLGANLFMNRTPEQSVAQYNPLQKYAMTQIASQLSGGNQGGADTSRAVANKLLQKGGVNAQAQSRQMPAFDVSQLFQRNPNVQQAPGFNYVSPGAIWTGGSQYQGAPQQQPPVGIAGIVKRGMGVG